jgi:hypothetical protein
MPSHHSVRFEVLTATSMRMAIFWDEAPYSLADVSEEFTASILRAIHKIHTSKKTHRISIKKVNWFVLFREIIVFSENIMKLVNRTHSVGKMQRFLMLLYCMWYFSYLRSFMHDYVRWMGLNL